MDLQAASHFCRAQNLAPVFAVNRAIPTWQLSYVWFIRDPRANHAGVEDFLAKAFLTNPYTTYRPGEPRWEERDLPAWLLSLTVTAADANFLRQVVAMARGDLAHAEPEDRDFTALDAIVLPEIGWQIKEPRSASRHPSGWTGMALFQVDGDYVLLEVHEES